MKKFEEIKTLEVSKLTKEEMYQVKGGMIEIYITVNSRSVCHRDGSDESDSDEY